MPKIQIKAKWESTGLTMPENSEYVELYIKAFLLNDHKLVENLTSKVASSYRQSYLCHVDPDNSFPERKEGKFKTITTMRQYDREIGEEIVFEEVTTHFAGNRGDTWERTITISGISKWEGMLNLLTDALNALGYNASVIPG